MTPEVCTVELCVIVRPLAVKLLRGVVPPTALENVKTPLVPPVKTKVWAPSSVLEKKMLLPAGAELVVFTVTGLVRETGPVIVTLPALVVRLPLRSMSVPV